MRLAFLFHGKTIALAVTVSLLLGTTNAFAAETVVLKYGIFRESISVKELTTFGETGEVSDSLKDYFNKSKQNPEAIRNALTQPIPAKVTFLDRTLNSRLGEIVLDDLSKFVHTPSGQADRQALRASLVLSASKSNQVSLISAIQNYPTKEVEVEGKQILNAYHRLHTLGERLQDLFDQVGQWF